MSSDPKYNKHVKLKIDKVSTRGKSNVMPANKIIIGIINNT